MNFGDFIDLDRRLHLDPGAERPAERLERDRRIGRALQEKEPVRSDEALLLAWKNQVEPDGPSPSFGELLDSAFRWTGVLLALLGASTGIVAASAFLRYDGTQPINVLFFLGAIVGIQLLLLPLLAGTFLFRARLRRGYRLARAMIGGLVVQVFGLFARFGISTEKAAELRSDLAALQGRNSFYKRIQPLLVLLLLQVFSVAFNLAAAATLLFFVLFSDLAFSWATTVQVEPEQIHRITTILSAPWAEIVPQARPTLELVEATRFVRMEGEFAVADPGAADRAGGWWRFLFVATVTYGLLPRLLALVSGIWLLKREMRRSVARSSQVQALKERLRTPVVRVKAEPLGQKAAAEDSASGVEAAAAMEKGLKFAALFWAYDEPPPEQFVERLLRERLDAVSTVRLEAGNLEQTDDAVMEKVQAAKAESGVGGAAVFFEPFEPPKTDVRRFLARLRETLGESRPIVVFLAEFAGEELQPVEAEEWEAWDRAIRAMADPFLLLTEREVAR